MTAFSTAAVFSNNCVLQRNKNISIFGTAETGSEVQVKLFDSGADLLDSNTGTARNNRWEIQLRALPAQTGCCLKISCGGEEICFENVAIGEVWLAGGQSNMEFELQNCVEGPAELAVKEDPDVRFYYTNKIAWMDEHFFEAEKKTCWQTWESEWKKSWSAVGFLFAKKLAADLGVTVGVIGCNWGGTSASAWMSKNVLAGDVDFKTYLDEQEEAVKGKSIQQQCDEYDAYEKENAVWQKKCDALYKENPQIEWDEVQKILGPALWPGPRSCKNPYRPGGLYECMLKRIIPYTLKGVIWYQGESDDHKPLVYYRLFSAMINQWRTDWNDITLPFVFVQLPGNRYKQDKDFKHWCLIREAQAKVHYTVKNAYMACALDLGQYNDIHPKAKKTIAERMEKAALCGVYNLISEETAFAPMLKSSLVHDGKITLNFFNAPDGFELRADDEALANYKSLEERQGNCVPEDFTGFEIAGADGIYYPAEFEFGKNIHDADTITLSSTHVKNPLYARYAWYNYGPAFVFGKNGLPLAPFTTAATDTKTETEHAEIQQIMTV